MALIRTGINLDSKQLEDLKKLSSTTGAPVSELVRRAIRDYIKNRQDFAAKARAALQKKVAP